MKKRNKIRRLALVVFDKKSCATDVYENHYKEIFGENTFLFMGEVTNAPGHCMLYNFKTEKIEGMFHTDNFMEAKSKEL